VKEETKKAIFIPHEDREAYRAEQEAEEEDIGDTPIRNPDEEETLPGRPILLPKAGADTFWREEEQTQPKIGEEWQKGLNQLDDIEPRNWILAGAQIGRRIPKEFRAPYRNILVNTCKEQDKQASLGNPIEMRRIEKLLILVQAMLHRIPKGESTNKSPPNAATLRAKQLHSRYFAFTQGRFMELLEEDDMLETGDPKKESKKTYRFPLCSYIYIYIYIYISLNVAHKI
jgi:hypothetical protein